MATATAGLNVLRLLRDKATQLRIDSVRATTAAGSGHPTSCASAAEILSVLFFSVLRYDPANPKNPDSDIFVLSKGHAAPLLYSAWAEAGFIPRERLVDLRKIDSDLEGHPTPRMPFVDVATGSLGQGLPVAVGMAWNAKRLNGGGQRVYVVMGDGEAAEGSVWEAAEVAAKNGLDNLCATIDINRLGQSQPTMLQHNTDSYKARWEAFGWKAIVVDGHDLTALSAAYDEAAGTRGRPSIILAKTFKGRELDGYEDKENQHGKPLTAAEADRVVALLEKQLSRDPETWKPNLPKPSPKSTLSGLPGTAAPSPYALGGKEVATRKAFGDALGALAKLDPRVVVIDGDVKNSTYTEEFEAAAPERFVEGYIAEQNMVGMTMGMAARGKIPFASTFACFLTRAYDFVRMAAISKLNIKLAGTHVGVSIGEDGASQMGLEDLAMFRAQPGFTVLYPSDATSAWKATFLLAQQAGPGYVRLGRPAQPILYAPDETFAIGKCKVLRRGSKDRAVIVAGGVTVNEALKAHEELKKNSGIETRVIDIFSVEPIDRQALIDSAKECGGIVITVEDHYSHGGLGDAVLSALSDQRFAIHKLAVNSIPRSGKPEELVDMFGISARHIVEAVQRVLR